MQNHIYHDLLGEMNKGMKDLPGCLVSTLHHQISSLNINYLKRTMPAEDSKATEAAESVDENLYEGRITHFQ